MKNEFHMSQRKYVQDVIKRFNIEDCKPLATPMNSAVQISKQKSPNIEEKKKRMGQIPYRNLIGFLMYLATSTRRDIAHALSALSQFNENPGEQQCEAAKRMLRYLKKAEKMEIVFSNKGDTLIGFADADWGANIDDRWSYTGYLFKLAAGAEAEYMALSEVANENTHLRRFLSEVMGKLKQQWLRATIKVPLWWQKIQYFMSIQSI